MLEVIFFVCVALPSVSAYSIDPMGNEFPATNILQCAEDAGSTPSIGLQANLTNTTLGRVTFLPVRSGFAYPRVLDSFGFVPAITPLLNINMNFQSLNRPNFSEVLYYPNRYVAGSADERGIQDLCGSDILSNFNDGDSKRHEDQGTFSDISFELDRRWLQILEEENITSEFLPRMDEQASRTSWTGEIIGFFNDTMKLLECRVAFHWVDAGPTYFPRYFRQGFCYNRQCSLPDRDEFRCHADLSADSFGGLEASRWDCCWTTNHNYQSGLTHKYECGFRKVTIPIVCDCDCRCLNRAGE
jgi:hypothetical protein